MVAMAEVLWTVSPGQESWIVPGTLWQLEGAHSVTTKYPTSALSTTTPLEPMTTLHQVSPTQSAEMGFLSSFIIDNQTMEKIKLFGHISSLDRPTT